MFMWGNNYDKLETAAADLEMEFVALVNFSATRFANSKRLVFKKLLRNIEPILVVLETDIERATANKNKKLLILLYRKRARRPGRSGGD